MAWLLVVALVALVPVALVRVPWAFPGGAEDFNRRITLQPFDLVLALILVRWLARLPRRRRPRPGWLGTTGLALAAVLLVALAVHPSPAGVALLVRYLAAWAVLETVIEAARTHRRHLLAGLAAVGTVQALLGMAQSARGGTLGLGPLEFGGPLYPFGTSRAGRGGLDHPYHLACLLAVTLGAALLGLRDADRTVAEAGRRQPWWPWAVALAVTGAGLATTYSRTAVLGLGVGLLVLLGAWVRRRDLALLLAVGAVAFGLLVGAVGFGDGWIAKGQTSTDTRSVDTGRRDRLQEAWRLIERDPLVGVGPGRYVEALRSVPHTDLLPAHDLVAQEAAEGGILAGILSAAILAGLAWRSLRRGAWSVAVLAPFGAFLLLDSYPFAFPTGLVVSGCWLGLLTVEALPVPAHDRLAATGAEPETADPAPGRDDEPVAADPRSGPASQPAGVGAPTDGGPA